MPGKKRCHDETARETAGHPAEQSKNQERIGDVETQVFEVVPAWLQAEHLAVKHVRPPSERMPAIEIVRGQPPKQASRSQSAADHRIIIDIVRIIQRYKREASHLGVDEQRAQGEEKAASQGWVGLDKSSGHRLAD